MLGSPSPPTDACLTEQNCVLYGTELHASQSRTACFTEQICVPHRTELRASQNRTELRASQNRTACLTEQNRTACLTEQTRTACFTEQNCVPQRTATVAGIAILLLFFFLSFFYFFQTAHWTLPPPTPLLLDIRNSIGLRVYHHWWVTDAPLLIRDSFFHSSSSFFFFFLFFFFSFFPFTHHRPFSSSITLSLLCHFQHISNIKDIFWLNSHFLVEFTITFHELELDHLVRTQSLNDLPLKPGVGQCIVVHATLTAKDFFLAYFYLSGPFICIFSKTSPDFS